MILTIQNIFWHASFARKQGAYVRTRIWQVWEDRSDRWLHPVRRPDQVSQKEIYTSPLDNSRRGNQNAYMERQIRTLYEGDMASRKFACRVDRLDRVSKVVRPVLVCRIRVEVVF